MSLTVLPARAAAFPRPIHPFRPPPPHALVERVEPGSIAEEIGIRPGDELLTLNGDPMEDVIDYRFLVTDEEVEVVVAPGGRTADAYTVTVEKDADETLGITFAADVFDGIRICTNNCDFCFVYQNRRGMRKSVYVKDDDYRLSFLHGDFITLTNLTERCWERIFRYHLSPLYVSIHATDPDARVTMLRNEEGARLMEHLERLFQGGIEIHGQVVYTPGINDGAVFGRTVEDMAALYHRGCRSLAVVPVGLTTLRTRLPALRTLHADEARDVLRRCRAWQRRFRQELGTRFVYPSDEMYLLAGARLPSARSYEEFPQYENGVGMVSRLRDAWRRTARRLPERVGCPLGAARRVTLVTGTLAAPVLAPLAARLSEVKGLDVRVAPVRNAFFGETVTVAGLLAGRDIAAQVSDPGDRVLLPSVALRDELFIDDYTLAELRAALGCEVRVVPPTAAALAEAVLAPAA